MADLQSLDLSDNLLRDDDMSALANHAARHWPHLRVLCIRNNSLGAVGMTVLADAARHWPQLQTLDLSCVGLCDFLIGCLAHAAGHWPQLHTLKLVDNHLGAAGMRALADAA
jgi:Ran GTPase-activating protein (RanGAP) involved in mRNA processing and transport